MEPILPFMAYPRKTGNRNHTEEAIWRIEQLEEQVVALTEAIIALTTEGCQECGQSPVRSPDA